MRSYQRTSTVSAVQWDGDNLDEAAELLERPVTHRDGELQWWEDGIDHRALPGTWIVRDASGRIGVIGAGEFAQTFTEVPA